MKNLFSNPIGNQKETRGATPGIEPVASRTQSENYPLNQVALIFKRFAETF